jgi:GNAT superfamily N-acetyltransferase
MEIRHLPVEDLTLVGEIDRSEQVDVTYAVEDGALISRPVDWDVPTWDAVGSGDHSVHRRIDEWGPILTRGGVLLGAFDIGAFAGLAIVEPRFEEAMAWLAVLHVSRRYRRMGAATALWTEAERLALAADAATMYVSATPSGSAVGFYLSRGCVLATPPHPALFAMEPEDIHLIREF